MPIYTFFHPESNETIEIAQKMTDDHTYVDEHGVEWRRVFEVPNASVDHEFSADMTESQFARATEGKNYTLGEMWDKSAELSAKRATKNGGEDPLKKKALKEYSKERRGMKHSSVTKQNLKKLGL